MRQPTRVPFDYKPDKPASQKKKRTRRLLFGLLAFPLLGGLTYTATNDRAPSEPELALAEETNETPETPVALASPALADTSPAIPIDADSPVATDEATQTAPSSAEPAYEQVDYVVRRNDTLERIFRKLKLNSEDLTAMLQAPGARRSLNRIRVGEKLTIFHDTGSVRSLNRRTGETEILSVRRGEEGFAVNVIITPIDIKTRYASGTIDTSLFVAARAADVGPETILRLANSIFGWDIDFALDIRPGDRFSMIYEQKYREGEYIGDGRILAAEFVNAGRTFRAVRYVSSDGKIDDYFTPEGRSMRRQFLRAPLDFNRVSSNFNPRRRHPILNRIRAHKGVDYAARPGTAIRAAGDGRIGFIGRKGGYGRVVILEHGGGISTLYAHMRSFARGLRPGHRVEQGQTIGYVGSSGAATGPHLHYEYRINGIHKNPRTVNLPDAAPIPAKYMADFRNQTGVLLASLEQMRGERLAAFPGD